MRRRHASRFAAVLLAGALIVTLLPQQARASTPRAPVVQQAPGPRQALAFFNILSAMFGRNKVYRRANQAEADIKTYYAGLLNTAVMGVQPAGSRSAEQQAAYVRLTQRITDERDAMLELTEMVKKGARKDFHTKLNAELPALLVALPGMTSMVGNLQETLQDLKTAVDGVKAASGGKVDEALLAHVKQAVGVVDGQVGVAQAVEGLAGSEIRDLLRQVAGPLKGLTAANGQIGTAAGDASAALDKLISRLGGLTTVRRPYTINGLGILNELLVPGKNPEVDAILAAMAGRGSKLSGLSAAELSQKLRSYINDLVNQQYKDCAKAVGALFRAQLTHQAAEGKEGEALSALPAKDDMSLCDPENIKAMLAEAEKYGATTVPDTKPGPTVKPDANPVVTVAGVYDAVDSARGFASGTFRILTKDPSVLTYAELVPPPVWTLTLDFAKGQATGSFSASYEKPAKDLGVQGEYAKGTFEGTFTVPLGVKPATAPPGWPDNPADWIKPEAGSKDWWFGGTGTGSITFEANFPISIARWDDGREEVTWAPVGPYGDDVTFWIAGRVSPSVAQPGKLPTTWYASFYASGESADDADPYFDPYLDVSTAFNESGLGYPPGADH
ncbi:MAG TPA: hypothetical protein VF855_13890 [Acidimicrobiales bacterium]